MPLLPKSGQPFSKIIKEGFLYIDKTEYIYNLAKSETCLFLSRPRRFGKSLLLGAMRELFRGNRELFTGLWIGKSDYDFTPYPVIHIGMTGACDTKEELKNSISSELRRAAVMNGLKVAFLEPSLMLGEIFAALMEKFGPDVEATVLIDEYDAPIQSVIADPVRARENRSVLHSFYGKLKTLSDEGRVRFLFVTGVTKFAKASFFSVFNNYHDLTLDRAYAGICGFTIPEFEDRLAGHLPGILEFNKSMGFLPAQTTLADFKALVYDFYDGYSWDGKTRVLNPFSVVNFLSARTLDPYWFNSATPTFLMELIRDNPGALNRVEAHPLNVRELEAVDVANLKLVPLLFQTGYLTVDKWLDSKNCSLREPNQEVSEALNASIVEALTGREEENIKALGRGLRRALHEANSAALAEHFKEILNWIPHEIHVPLENYYHSVFLAVLKALSLKVRSEESTAEGRLDLRLELSGQSLYIFEFKFKKYPPGTNSKTKARSRAKTKTEAEIKAELMAAAIEEAKTQIIDKGYAQRDLREYEIVRQVAVGIVGRSLVGAELVKGES
ncbi:MAG: ATP-binding protein [Deltaproteobacteria bacterium]|jgi:hypothetical protein|nr:ATP-binding protein [Deltaproteobacteria bacterium]